MQTAAKSVAQGVTSNVPQTTQSAMLIMGEPTRRQFLRGFGAFFAGSPVSVC